MNSIALLRSFHACEPCRKFSLSKLLDKLDFLVCLSFFYFAKKQQKQHQKI